MTNPLNIEDMLAYLDGVYTERYGDTLDPGDEYPKTIQDLIDILDSVVYFMQGNDFTSSPEDMAVHAALNILIALNRGAEIELTSELPD